MFKSGDPVPNPAFSSKPLYLECVTLVDHVSGPLAACIELDQAFIDRIRTISAGLRFLGLTSGEIENAPGVPRVDPWEETGLQFDVLKVNASDEFVIWGADRIGARTETRGMSIEALQAALDSSNSVEIGPVYGAESPAAFVEALEGDIPEEDSEALRAAYPIPTSAIPPVKPKTNTSLAFQITSEDVENVLRTNWAAVANTGGRTFEQIAETAFDELNFFEIEKAALYGDDLDAQTANAYEAIAKQLREQGVLEPQVDQASPAEQPSNG